VQKYNGIYLYTTSDKIWWFIFSYLGKNSQGKLKVQDPGLNLSEELKKYMWNSSKRERNRILDADPSTVIPFIFSCFQNYEVSSVLCA